MTKVFISYKTGLKNGLTCQANYLRTELEQRDYDVWMDREKLESGKKWNEQLYAEIPMSDILLLLLAPEAIQSRWLHREVDIARGSKVTIIPVIIREGVEPKDALLYFDLDNTQCERFIFGDEDEIDSIAKAIERRKDDTKKAQRKFNEARFPKNEVKEINEKAKEIPSCENYRCFTIQGSDVKVMIAGGDLMEMKGIDALVNSENALLQMARIIDDKTTLSSLLRYYGSEVVDGSIRNDAVQFELSERAKGVSKPVEKGKVYTTSSGHPTGKLASEMHAKHIIHAVTIGVKGDGANRKMDPVEDPKTLEKVVRRVLEELESGDAKGSESIYLPMFNTGHGGIEVEVVAPIIVSELKRYLIDNEDLDVKRIHLGAFTYRDAEVLEKALLDHGFGCDN